MATNKELLAQVAELRALVQERTAEPTTRDRIEADLRAHGVEPRVTVLKDERPTCSWTVKATDPIDALIGKADDTWSDARVTNLQHVADLNVGDVCGAKCKGITFSPKTGEQYPPLCGIHLSMARMLRLAKFDNSITKDRKAENESVFEAAIAAANKAKDAGGPVYVTNVSFGQYLVRVHGAAFENGMVRIELPKGRAAFVAAVNAGKFVAGGKPVAVAI